MAKEKDDFFDKLLAPSRREAVFRRARRMRGEGSLSLEDEGPDYSILMELLQSTANERAMTSMMMMAGRESPIHTLNDVTSDLIVNTTMQNKARSSTSAEGKEASIDYVRELEKAQLQIKQAGGFLAMAEEESKDIFENPTLTLAIKQQLEEGLLHLQGLVLQGPPSFRILKESVKELSQAIDQLVIASGSCAMPIQEINNICREIKTDVESILETLNAKEKEGASTTTDNVIYDVIAFDKTTKGRLKSINDEILELINPDTIMTLNLQLLTLEGKCLVLRFAAQSIRASNRLVYLSENLYDVLNVYQKILSGSFPHPNIKSSKSILLSVPSNLLRAMYNIVSQRSLGAAFMQYVDNVLNTEHTPSCSDQKKFLSHLKSISHRLIKLLMVTCTHVINWKDYVVTTIMRAVLEEASNGCGCQPPLRIIDWQIFDFDLLNEQPNLFFISNKEDENEKKIEDLQKWATQMTLLVVREIQRMSVRGVNSSNTISVLEVACSLAWEAQKLQRDNDPAYNEKITEASRDIIFQAINLAGISEFTQPMQQQPIAVEGRLQKPILHEIQQDVEMVDLQEARIGTGPLKVRPIAQTFYVPSAITAGVSSTERPSDRSEDELVQGFYDSPYIWRNMRRTFAKSHVRSSTFAATACAGKFSEPNYVQVGGSSTGASGEGSGGVGGSGSGSGGGGGSGGGSGVGSSGASGWGLSEGSSGGIGESSGEGSLGQSVSVSHDPVSNSINYIQFLDACRSLNDAINNLCRIMSWNRMRLDCGELLRNLLLQQALLQSRRPSCALSYEECLQKFSSQHELISTLRCIPSMPMVAFWRKLRFVSAAVCTSSELAAQCAYLILVSELNPEAPRSGVVDIIELQNVLKIAQTTCYKMLTLAPREAKEESFRLMRQVQNIGQALTDAGRRAHGLREVLDSSMREIHECAMKLSGSFRPETDENEGDRDPQYQETISAATWQMLNRLRAVGRLAEEPGLLPVQPAAGAVTDGARDRSDHVLRAAKNLTSETILLVQEVIDRSDYVDDDETIRWSAFDPQRGHVVAAVEELSATVEPTL